MSAAHISDLLRFDVARRDWKAMHVRADRRLPINLGDRVTRNRDGQEITIRPWLGSLAS